MSEKHNSDFVYTVIPDDDGVLFSVCCYDEKGRKIKTIDSLGEKEVTEEFCRFLNEGKVHPCHCEDIFDDYFG